MCVLFNLYLCQQMIKLDLTKVSVVEGYLFLNPRAGPTRLAEEPVKAAYNLLPHPLLWAFHQIEQNLEESVSGLLVRVVRHCVQDQGHQSWSRRHHQTWNKDWQGFCQEFLRTRTTLRRGQGESTGKKVTGGLFRYVSHI